MSNSLSPELLAQLFAQESSDPFLTLLTLTHPTFTSPIRLVNNSVQIISRGNTFLPFPVSISLPADDGETIRQVSIVFDNVSLELINEIRSTTTGISVKLEMVLASAPDQVQIELDELTIVGIQYNAQQITARLQMDNFLNSELGAETYGTTNFRGLF